MIFGFGHGGADEGLVEISWEGAVEGIAYHGDHPGECGLGAIGGFDKGHAIEEGGEEGADFGSEAEEGLVDGSHGGGGTF